MKTKTFQGLKEKSAKEYTHVRCFGRKGLIAELPIAVNELAQGVDFEGPLTCSF